MIRNRRATLPLGRRALRRRVKYVGYAGLWLVVRLALHWLLGLRVTGARRFPRAGPVIVVANHLHNFDPIVLSAALPRPIYYMAKQELFAHPLFAWLIRNFGAFPVNRGAPDRAALRQALALLDEGLAVGLFPEGTRGVTGVLGDAYPGVALVALRSGAPLVPVAITGTETLPFDAKAAGRARRRRAPLRVVVGAPFTVARDEAAKVDLTATTDRIMREIAALLPAEYRGRYHDTTSRA